MSGSATLDTVGGAFDAVGTRQGNNDDAATKAAQEAYTRPEDPQARQAAVAAFNTELENNKVIPGLQITDMGTDSEHQTLDITGVAGIQQGASVEATYDPTTHNLTYAREGVSGNTEGKETVSVNMVTGRETVSYINDKNTLVTETRNAVGDQYPSSTTQYTPPAGATNFAINPDTGRPTFDLNGKKVSVAPTADNTILSVDGRDYKVDRNNNLSYQVKEGDNLWSIAKDITALNGGDPNNDATIRQTVDQLAHEGKGGDEDLIITGDTLTFGANSGHPEDAINMQDFNAHPETGERPESVNLSPDGRTWFPPDSDSSNPASGVALPDDVASTPVMKDGNLEYKNSQGNTVTLTPSGQESTLFEQDGTMTTVKRENAGEAPSEIIVTQQGQPEIKMELDGDNTYIVSKDGEVVDNLGGITFSVDKNGHFVYNRGGTRNYRIADGNYQL